MSRNRLKPGNRSYAGTGEAPISIQTENKLEKAVAEATLNEKRVTILEEENKRLQLQLEQRLEDVERAAEEARLVAEKAAADKAEADRLVKEARTAEKAANKILNEAEKVQRQVREQLE